MLKSTKFDENKENLNFKRRKNFEFGMFLVKIRFSRNPRVGPSKNAMEIAKKRDKICSVNVQDMR